jgi:hypothetical protein
MNEEAPDWDETTTWHAPNGDLFAPLALCGSSGRDEPGGHLRMHSDPMTVTCARCRRLMLEVVGQ